MSGIISEMAKACGFRMMNKEAKAHVPGDDGLCKMCGKVAAAGEVCLEKK